MHNIVKKYIEARQLFHMIT